MGGRAIGAADEVDRGEPGPRLAQVIDGGGTLAELDTAMPALIFDHLAEVMLRGAGLPYSVNGP